MTKIKNKFITKPLLDINGEPLTNRESECIYLMLLGNTTKETARELAISPRTVEVYITNIKYKLQCFSKSEIISRISMNKANQIHISDLFCSLSQT